MLLSAGLRASLRRQALRKRLWWSHRNGSLLLKNNHLFFIHLLEQNFTPFLPLPGIPPLRDIPFPFTPFLSPSRHSFPFPAFLPPPSTLSPNPLPFLLPAMPFLFPLFISPSRHSFPFPPLLFFSGDYFPLPAIPFFFPPFLSPSRFSSPLPTVTFTSSYYFSPFFFLLPFLPSLPYIPQPFPLYPNPLLVSSLPSFVIRCLLYFALPLPAPS